MGRSRIIESPQNPFLREMHAILTPRGIKRHRKAVVCGDRVVTEAIRTVVAKARGAGKFIGSGLGGNAGLARTMAEWGVQWIHVGCDHEYLRLAAESLFEDIRAGS